MKIRQTAVLNRPNSYAYCGPTAFYSVTEVPTSKFEKEIRKIRKSDKPVSVVHMYKEVVKVAKKLGFDTTYYYHGETPDALPMTLENFLRDADIGKYIVSLWFGNHKAHAIAVEKIKGGDAYIADTHNRKPIRWSTHGNRINKYDKHYIVAESIRFDKWHKPRTGGKLVDAGDAEVGTDIQLTRISRYKEKKYFDGNAAYTVQVHLPGRLALTLYALVIEGNKAYLNIAPGIRPLDTPRILRKYIHDRKTIKVKKIGKQHMVDDKRFKRDLLAVYDE